MSGAGFSFNVVALVLCVAASAACSDSNAAKPFAGSGSTPGESGGSAKDAATSGDGEDGGASEPTQPSQTDAGRDAGSHAANAGQGGDDEGRAGASSEPPPDTNMPGEGGDPDDAGVILVPPPPAADSGVQPEPPPPPVMGPDGCIYFVLPSDCTTPDGRPLPGELRCTGLYGDWATRTLACGVKPYRPAFELYSDGAQKQRWYSLPEGAHIDGSNPEGFVYPVGTQFWKEFRVQVGEEARLVETRLLRKVSTATNGWVYTSYVWDEAGQTAVQSNEGVINANGTDHDVPTLEQCKQCHQGRADYILGWDTIMLGAGATGTDLTQLVQSGILENMPATAPQIPGQDRQALGLGYLHANCGISCHNVNGDAADSGLMMRLDTDKLGRVEDTPAFVTGFLKVPWENAKIGSLTAPADLGAFRDFYPFRPDASLALVRMQVRGTEAQMPPIATKHVDEMGVAQVQALVQ